MINLTINGKSHSVDVEPDTPLLWVIRDNIGMMGTARPKPSRSRPI